MAWNDLRMRRLLTAAAIAAYAASFTVFVLLERPGLGFAHAYYVGIVLAAIAWGRRGGVVSAVVAAALYALGVYLNPRLPNTLPSEATSIRLVAYLLVGVLIGHYATRSREGLAQADELTRELRLLAGRDYVTGLPNQRAFEKAANARIAAAVPFLLVICDLPAGPSTLDPAERMLDFAQRLSRTIEPDADVARIGEEQFAVLVPIGRHEHTSAATDAIERSLGSDGRRATAGWASFPRDAGDALGLYTAASERLYARKIARGEWAAPASR